MASGEKLPDKMDTTRLAAMEVAGQLDPLLVLSAYRREPQSFGAGLRQQQAAVRLKLETALSQVATRMADPNLLDTEKTALWWGIERRADQFAAHGIDLASYRPGQAPPQPGQLPEAA